MDKPGDYLDGQNVFMPCRFNPRLGLRTLMEERDWRADRRFD